MIVVTGATGNIGGPLVAELLRREAAVRAVVRDPAQADLPEGVEIIPGDLGEPASLRAAMTGAERVFLMPGYPGIAEAARAGGARHIVQLSGGSAGSGDLSNAMTRYMTQSENEARDTGLDWTFLRPTAFMSNALRWLPQLQQGDVVRLPFAGVALASVDPADIAAVAAVALTEDGHHAMVYRPTGPEALYLEQQVAVLAEVLGRPLHFEAQGNDEARRDMLSTVPPDYVGAFFDFYVNGSLDETTVRPTVHDVTGRPPATFQHWARTNAHRFTDTAPTE